MIVLDVTSPVKLVEKIRRAIALGSKPPLHTRITRPRLATIFLGDSFCFATDVIATSLENKTKSLSLQWELKQAILGLQPGDKAAIFSRRIYMKIEFSSQRREILARQHGRHVVTCKPAIS